MLLTLSSLSSGECSITAPSPSVVLVSLNEACFYVKIPELADFKPPTFTIVPFEAIVEKMLACLPVYFLSANSGGISVDTFERELKPSAG